MSEGFSRRRILGVGDASINLQTAVAALSRLENR